jgi:hypothetical protein
MLKPLLISILLFFVVAIFGCGTPGQDNNFYAADDVTVTCKPKCKHGSCPLPSPSPTPLPECDE